MADPPPVMSSARYGPFAAFLPPIVDQGLEGVCAFASTSQYLKFIVSRQFVLNPAELDGWLPHQWLMEQMLAVPGNTYGLSRNAETGDCPTSPITILRFLRDHLGVVPSPQGPLIFPPIHTLRSVQNVQNIDGGVHGDEEAEVEVFKPLDAIWIQVTQIIDMFGSILGELEAVDEQLKHHKKPGAGVFVSRKGPGRTRRGKMIGHSVLVTGHNGTQGGRRYLEVQNTFGPEWGGAGDGKIKTKYEQVAKLKVK